MISMFKNSNTIATENGETKAIEFRGLSTDTKPTTFDGKKVQNGAIYLEMDSGKVYLFDAENEQWKVM